MENKTTPLLWIKEREEELKLLEKEVESLEAKIKQVGVEIANCEDEIEFIKELQSKDIGLCHSGSGEKLLIEMRAKLEEKKTSLEKTREELSAKVIKRDNLKVYVGLAYKRR